MEKEETKKKGDPLRFSFVIFTVLLIGMNRTSMSNFLPDYYKNFIKLNQNNNKILLSVCSCAGVLGEILIFNVNLTNKIGLFFPLLFGTLFQLLRFICYCLLKPFHSYKFIKICLIEIMKGLTFSMVHASCTGLAKKYGGTKQTMALFIYNGTYVALGNLLAGIFLSKTLNQGNNFSSFFKANTFICLTSLLLIIIMRLIYTKGWKH